MTRYEILDTEPTRRRDVLIVAVGAVAAAGATAMLWPAVERVELGASLTWANSIRVDLVQIEPGQSISVLWDNRPVIVRRRTAEEIAQARSINSESLPDSLARNPDLPSDAPATDENRVKPGHDEWLVVIGVCTHLGCSVGRRGGSWKPGDFGGWFCACHGSHFDVAGRIRKGPAPENLAIPPYRFLADSVLEIG